MKLVKQLFSHQCIVNPRWHTVGTFVSWGQTGAARALLTNSCATASNRRRSLQFALSLFGNSLCGIRNDRKTGVWVMFDGAALARSRELRLLLSQFFPTSLELLSAHF